MVSAFSHFLMTCLLLSVSSLYSGLGMNGPQIRFTATHTHTHAHKNTHTYTHTHTHTHTHTQTHTRMHTRTHTHTHTHTRTHTHTHTHIHTHMRAGPSSAFGECVPVWLLCTERGVYQVSGILCPI